MSFSLEDQARINEVVTRLRVTHDSAQLSVTGLSHDAWMLFSYNRGLEVEAMSANIQYQTLIHGRPNPSWHEINAAWIVARQALENLSAITEKTLSHFHTTSQINASVAAYLAMKERVDQWGGFSNEREHLPRVLEALSERDRATVEARLRGEIIEEPCPE